MATTKLGSDLEIGDCIKVWWRPRADIITSIEPYEGKLFTPDEAKIARFALFKTGMTLFTDQWYELATPEGEAR
jgi:hypothetical protein